MKCTLHKIDRCRRTLRCIDETDSAGSTGVSPGYASGGYVSGGIGIDPITGAVAMEVGPSTYIDLTPPAGSDGSSSSGYDSTPAPDPTPSYDNSAGGGGGDSW